MCKPRSKTYRPESNQLWYFSTLFFRTPFISDIINSQILKIFIQSNLNVRLCHKGFSLRNALNSKKPISTTCTMIGCPINDTLTCLSRNVVYKIKCSICGNEYIGSTIRTLHTRIKEHLTISSSSVFKHLQHCQTHSISTHILAKDRDTLNLRLKEAIFIRKFRPTINSKAECDELKDFLY